MLLVLVMILVMVGCTTRTKYYPPTKDVFIEVKDEDGKVIEVRGAVMEVSEEFDLGSEGIGEYYLFKLEAL